APPTPGTGSWKWSRPGTRRAVPPAPPRWTGAPAPALRPNSRSGLPGGHPVRGAAELVAADQAHEPELANLHLVAPGQRRGVDPLPVDVGAVQAAHVMHAEGSGLPPELRVPAGDRHVVQEDVAVRVPAGGGDILVPPEPAAGVWDAPDHPERPTRRQRVDRAELTLDVQLRLLGRLFQAADVDHRGRFARPRVIRGLAEWGAALRAVAAGVGVLVAAPGAVHGWVASWACTGSGSTGGPGGCSHGGGPRRHCARVGRALPNGQPRGGGTGG